MAKTIRMTLNPQSIDKAIRELEAYNRDLPKKAEQIIQRLADYGVSVARVGFSNVYYDGVNDVQVEIEDKGELHKAVVAQGQAVLFIEYGTGVHFADNHPKKPEGILGRGEYGKGRGSNDWWIYSGQPGTAGGELVNGRTNATITHGNPANPVMYNTTDFMRNVIGKVVKEVFGA